MLKLLISPVGFNLQPFDLEVSSLESGLSLYNHVSLFCGEQQIKLLFKGRNIHLEKTLQEAGIGQGGKIIMMRADDKKPQKNLLNPPVDPIIKTTEKPIEEVTEPIQSKPSRPAQENIICSESRISNILIWGSNSCGKLGTEDIDYVHTPFTVRLPCKAEIIMVACGSCHTAALDIDGKMYYWGRSLYPKESVSRFAHKSEPFKVDTVKGTRFLKVVAGTGHSLALDSKGNIWSWGEGIHGQLGHGVLDNEYYPRMIETIQGLRFIDIAAGGQHSVGLLPNETSIIWGKNQGGQLGTGDKIDRILPALLLNFKASQVKCGNFHTVWAKNSKVYLSGNSKSKPELLIGDVKHFECGGYNTYVVTFENILMSFDPEGKVVSEKVLKVKKVVSSGTMIFLLLEDGRVVGKGDNRQGQLGAGDVNVRYEWTDVRIPYKVASLDCSDSHACAVSEPSDLASDLGKALQLNWKDTAVHCTNGTVQAHKILLNSHTDPALIFDDQGGYYRTSLDTKCTEFLIVWLYSGKIQSTLNSEELSSVFFLAKAKNIEKLAEQVKQQIDEKEADRNYLLYFPESQVVELLNKMASEERKIHNTTSETPEIDSEISSENDSGIEIDAYDNPDSTELLENMEIDPVSESPEEKRKKFLEAIEKRLNNS